MRKRMPFTRFALLALTLPLATTAQVQPAVQPGGDIPPSSRTPQRPALPLPSPRPRLSPAPVTSFQYERRETLIPMRDGVRLHAVLIVPRFSGAAAGKYPIMLDRTP